MLDRLLISMPMMICFFWSIFFFIRCYKGGGERRVDVDILLFYTAATVLYFDHWLYFSGVVSLFGEWSYGVVNLCVYPLYYAYLRALTRARRNAELPALLLTALGAVFLFPIGRFGGCMADRTMFLFIRICFAVQVIWVLVRGYRLLLRTVRRMNDTYSDDRGSLLRPTHFWLPLFGVTAVISMLLNVIGRDLFAREIPVAVPAAVMSVLLYGLGFVAAHTDVPAETVIDEQPTTTTHVPDEQANALIRKIDTTVSERTLFTNPALTILDLAGAVNSNRSYVSAAINQTYRINFSTYINRFRVEEAKRILAEDGFSCDKQAIADAIARSGFNSDQTFYRVFKEQTALTPVQYRHKHFPQN